MDNQVTQQISAAVRAIADPLFSAYTVYRPQVYGNHFEIKAQPGDNHLEKATVLDVFVNDEFKEIQIPTIYLPQDLHKYGYGKSIIAAVREVAKRNGYRLFITNLVESFHRRLLARGADRINHEVVEITGTTDLTHRH